MLPVWLSLHDVPAPATRPVIQRRRAKPLTCAGGDPAADSDPWPMPSTLTLRPRRTSPLDSEDLLARLERHHLECFGWARSCCRQDPDEAENVLQAVYLKIFERKAVFDGRAAFTTWLFAVIPK